MGQDLFDKFPHARSIFERVSEATQVDVAKLCFESDEETLRQTVNAQIALYTCGIAAWSVFVDQHGTKPFDCVAGHSVGEYAALAAAEILAIEDGARLVQLRGRLMFEVGQKQPGTMAAVLGLTRDELEEVCVATEGIVVIANDNCPGQLVISGTVEAVKLAGELASQVGAKRVMPLNVSGAFHSPLMEEPAKEMGEALRAVTYRQGRCRVYSNVTSEPVPDEKVWASLLETQLCTDVRWTESIVHMRRDGIHTFIECGVGEVLSGLIRRIDKEATTLKIYNEESYLATIAALEGKTGS